jgi:UDP-N-acetylglucosamine diphosphorylase / glucose-1-phosphate thymidylyltransferase / UDP-N-acetylgalactosamine diphosphorylase / glucosamine-1-phosphate N-acetyltransferase / galactosamine-1-phosphate N-acetyltransferase
MQAVILAAGMGTRMRELTQDMPKPLLRSGEKSLLEHKLDHLPREIDEVILVVGYLGDRIRSAIGGSYGGLPVRYVEQTELNGTGHALQLCQPLLKGRFLVLMGDDLYRKEDLEQLLKYPCALLAWPLPADEPGKKMGAIVCDGAQHMTDIMEKQEAKAGMLMNTGAYVLGPRFFEVPLVPAGNGSTELGLPQTMVSMAKAGEPIKIVTASWWRNVTSPEDLEDLALPPQAESLERAFAAGA